jgi:hypothetical protein
MRVEIDGRVTTFFAQARRAFCSRMRQTKSVRASVPAAAMRK